MNGIATDDSTQNKQVQSNNEPQILPLKLSEKTKQWNKKHETSQFWVMKHVQIGVIWA